MEKLSQKQKLKYPKVFALILGIETLLYAISLPLTTQGKQMLVSRGISCRDTRVPVGKFLKISGVVLTIVPFNFPFMVPFWTIPISLALGNTVVLKSSEKCPLTMNFVAGLFDEAGFPHGVFNVINGGGETAKALAELEAVNAITFVGTSTIAESVYKNGVMSQKRVVALGGAKNHLVAYKDCDLGMTSTDVVSSFTGCTGQRCMAASVLLTIGEQQELINAIVSKAKSIKFGTREGSMGPVVDKQSLIRISNYIDQAEKSGAQILLDGRNPSISTEFKDGFWVGPTVILHSSVTDKILHEEVFGPVLSILPVASKKEAIKIENTNKHGNAACDYRVADWFSDRFMAGMIGVNVGVPVPREPFSFGGVGKSRFGDFDITGEGAVEFFTWRKKVTTKWTPPIDQDWMS